MAFGLSAGALSTIASVAGPVVSGLMQSGANSSAVNAQQQGADKASETQKYMYDTTRADNAPFLNNGVSGNNKLAYLLGLNPLGNGMGGAGSGLLTRDQLRQQLLSQYTKPGMAPNNDGHVYMTDEGEQRAIEGPRPNTDFQRFLDSMAARSNAPSAANGGSTVDEAGLSAEIERRLAEQTAQQQAQQQQAQNDPAYGSLLRKFSMNDLQADVPYQTGMQFGLDQGVQGINRMAAANGGTDNGAILKALARFGNDYGNQKAGEAYNRFTNDQTGIYNKLAGISGTGQTAVSQVGAAGQNYANQVSQNQVGMGNARAASAIGSANALGGGITQGYNNYQQNKLMNQLFPQSGGYTAGFGDPTYGAGADYSGFDSTWG